QGTIDRAQYLADAARQFAAMDIDGRGEVTPEELSRYRAPYQNEDVAVRPGSGGQGHRGNSAQRIVLDEDVADPVMVADVNLRFRVSRAEFLAYEGRKFDGLDKGHSGRLTKAQIVATCEKPRG